MVVNTPPSHPTGGSGVTPNNKAATMSTKRDLSSRARFNQLQWINLEGSGPFKRNGKNVVVYALAAVAAVAAVLVVLGVKISVHGITSLITDPAEQWFRAPAVDRNPDLSPDVSPVDATEAATRSLIHRHNIATAGATTHATTPRRQRARYTAVGPPRGVVVEPGVSSALRDVPDFDGSFKGNLTDVGTRGRYALNPKALTREEVTDRSYFVYTEVLPGYTALACNW